MSFCSARYFRLLCLLLRLHASRACAMAMVQLLALLSQAVRNLLAQGLKFQHPSQGLACGDAPGKHKPVGGGNKLRETPVCRCDLPSLLIISILPRLLASPSRIRSCTHRRLSWPRCGRARANGDRQRKQTTIKPRKQGGPTQEQRAREQAAAQKGKGATARGRREKLNLQPPVYFGFSSLPPQYLGVRSSWHMPS